MRISTPLRTTAREFARYCGEPWPMANYQVSRFICMMIRWAGDSRANEADRLLKEAVRQSDGLFRSVARQAKRQRKAIDSRMQSACK